MKRIIFEGLELIDTAEGFMVGQPISGLEAPVFSITSYQKSGEDGIVVSNIYSRERRVIIPGIIRASCNTDLIERRRLLSSRVLPDKDTDGRLEQKTLRLIDYDDSDYTIFVQSVNLIMPRGNQLASQYQLDLLADDAAVYSTSTKSGIATISTGGWFSIPFSIPFSFVGGVDGSVSVVNDGDIDSYPIVTFNGPLTNPRLRNETTGLFIQLNTTINTGEYIEIDMKNKTILLNGSVNRMSTMTSNSDWWWVAPGSNTLVLTSSDDNDTGNATVEFRDAYSGL